MHCSWAAVGDNSSACNVGDAVIAANGHRPLDEAGCSKWKRVPRQMPDALNGCLCGMVVDSQSDGVLKCKKLGCEMQWARLSIFHTKKVLYHSPTFKYHLIEGPIMMMMSHYHIWEHA